MSVSRELINAIKIMTARESAGEYVPEHWDEWFSEEELIAVASKPVGTCYVTVYALDRVYGGPEEGGWWFDTGEVVLSLCAPSQEVADMWADMLSEEYVSHGNRYSVIYYRKDTDYNVNITDYPGKNFPEHTPHYE